MAVNPTAEPSDKLVNVAGGAGIRAVDTIHTSHYALTATVLVDA